MPSDIKECSLYSFTVHGVKTKTTPKDITARAAAEAAQTTANGKQDALTAAQLAAVNSGITAEKVAGYDAFNVPSAFSGSPEMDGTASPGSTNAWARGDHVHPHDTSKQDALTTTQMAAVNSGATAAKVAAWDAIEVPTKTSDLTNDSGFITAAAIPAVPTKTSDLTNDSGFVTSAAIPDSTSDLTNDSGFITASDIPAIPSKTSELINDAGFITGYTETDPTVPAWAKASTKPTYTAAEVGALPDTTVIPTVPTDVSAFNNDAGYLTSYTETDPTVPAWAKASSKPTYTAVEVGAQAALTSAQMDAVNSGITADDLAENDAAVLCTATPIVPTLTNGSHHAAYGKCYYYKRGSRVTVHIGVSGVTASTDTTLWTLPAGYRPRSMVAAVGCASTLASISRLQITQSGKVLINSQSTYALADITFDAFA